MLNLSPVLSQGICLNTHNLWDDPEGWDGEGDGTGVQDGEHMYTPG